MHDGEPVWAWRGPYFLVLVLALPFVWAVTRQVPLPAARWCVRGGLLVAAAAIALEYNHPAGYGWLFDMLALLTALVATMACGFVGQRRRTLPGGVAWALIASIPITAVAGFLAFWYQPPALVIGFVVTWALAATYAGPGLPTMPSSNG